MTRYTPLYGLPALEPSTPVRNIADVDWQNAQRIEQILANEGRPPLASELVDLIKRLNALETAPKGRAQQGGVVTATGNVAAQSYGPNFDVKFTAGLFTKPPLFFCSAGHSRITAAFNMASLTKDGVQINTGNWSPAVASNVSVSWFAVAAD
ncbi:hypothetical protein [Curtobacterium sp. 1544]|uniref:hypothetical protein n=1 Tax=Curtobacterium sp. 1544 TaxID=3156417 RepID=UPI00339453D7